MHLLEHCIRKDLDTKAPRTMVVIDPVLVVIENVDENFKEELSLPDFPKNPERGTHKVSLTKRVYADRSDIRSEGHDDFWGIAPGNVVGLKYAGAFKVLEVKKSSKGISFVFIFRRS